MPCAAASRATVHPRVGGGAGEQIAAVGIDRGPSPRGRGSPTPGQRRGRNTGSIPAWAGEPEAESVEFAPTEVHPRVGGGALASASVTASPVGPSPRGRGSQACADWDAPAGGSIPAWAGEPSGETASRASTWVHPRVDGGAAMSASTASAGPGPSPRGRGSPRDRAAGAARRGSIPAWAGEPTVTDVRHYSAGVHPRVGGGALMEGLDKHRRAGPSPRGRGSHRRDPRHRPGGGSIPAWAGEPPRPIPSPPPARSIPAWAGEPAGSAAPARPPGLGPSPRGRGSPRRRRHEHHHRRSIPAWAGEPSSTSRGSARRPVHPRVGGGAEGLPEDRKIDLGPSPRGRGSPQRPAREREHGGSIPAWAGEPWTTSRHLVLSEVHPRVGGGARDMTHPAPIARGPSPRGRGSLRLARFPLLVPRSIPAWAGEPVARRREGRLGAVHPRVGGGASVQYPAGRVASGPSPRGRGSQATLHRRLDRDGSIPAWAGEPRVFNSEGNHVKAHPRVGGGASPWIAPASSRCGPSPRGRGSHVVGEQQGRPRRSIPAWAGEPRDAVDAAELRRVHPRVGGGAPH